MKKNGRPFSEACDKAEKPCPKCGRIFRLREKTFQSLGRFAKRKFCSRACTASGPVVSTPETFWASLSKRENGCWEWVGRKYPKGYGKIARNGKDVRAHRYAYSLAKGPIPDGMMILHSCDNPPCCNPDHLRAGTAKENREDAISRGRVRGSSVADRNDPRIFIGTIKAAAEVMGVSPATIHRIRAVRPNKSGGVIQRTTSMTPCHTNMNGD